jgi:Uma2 family endonuclease
MADPGRTNKKEATYQDVLDAPEHMIAELIDGELVVSPRPRSAHAAAASALAEELGPPFKRGRGGPGGWIILFEPELHLGKQILVPDLAGWRRERLPQLVDEAFFTLAPDWVCEVLSKATEKRDRTDKRRIYAAAGVQYMWIVHPILHTLEAMRLHEGKWLTIAVHQDEERVRVEPFEAIELDLSTLWADVASLPTRAGEGAADYEYADW